MFDIDDKELKHLERDLKTFAKRAYPFASKNTLNRAAFTGQKLIKADLQRDFTLRNRFTVQSIQVEQTRTLNVAQQQAILGTTAPYLEDQEFGGVKSKKSKQGVPIPTTFASGEEESAQPRTRLPKKGNKLQSIQLKRRRRAKNKKQELIFKVQDAVATGRRFFFHDFGGSKKRGIFRVIGGSKKTKRGWPDGAVIKMVWDLSESSVRVPKHPIFKPMADEVGRLLPLIHRDSLLFQLKRHGLFKDS